MGDLGDEVVLGIGLGYFRGWNGKGKLDLAGGRWRPGRSDEAIEVEREKWRGSGIAGDIFTQLIKIILSIRIQF